MTSLAEKVIQSAAQADPNSPILQAANAAVSTVENPSPSNILADIELAWSIISLVKARLDKTHTSLWVALKELL